GAESLGDLDLRAADPEEASLGDLALAEPYAHVPLDHLERDARRREEDLVLARADPERTAGAAGGEHGVGNARVEPRGCERAVQLLEHARVVVRVGGEAEDRLRVH